MGDVTNGQLRLTLNKDIFGSRYFVFREITVLMELVIGNDQIVVPRRTGWNFYHSVQGFSDRRNFLLQG